MFSRTYGILYKQNADIFMNLFRDLRQFYKGQNFDLMDTMESFFDELMIRMFTLTHSDKQFSDEFLSCTAREMRHFKPFGDVPEKMSRNIKKAFAAARTFVQALQTGRDVISDLSKVSLSIRSDVTPSNSVCISFTRVEVGLVYWAIFLRR